MADAPLLLFIGLGEAKRETPPLPGQVVLATYTFVQDGHPSI